MTQSRTRKAVSTAATHSETGDDGKWAVLAGGAVLAAALWAGQARGESHENVTVSHGYTNFGELKYPADFPHLDYVNPDAPRGGNISLWSQSNFDNFNPYAFDGVSAANATIGNEAVLTSTADDAYGVYCFLCESLEYDEALTFVSFNLRDDVTFSDGTPMTAADVEFSFNLFLEQGIPEYRLVRSTWIDRVEVEDDYRITFRFTEAAPIRERVTFVGGTPVFSKAWFEENEVRLDEPYDTPFMATGRYVLDDFDFGRFVSYRANPDYWARDLNWSVGRQNFETIRTEVFADAEAAFQAFTAGEYTFRTENSSLIWATRYDFPALDRGWVVRESLPDGQIPRRQGFQFQLEREKWQDIGTRRAIALMYNFEWTNETLQYGLFQRPISFWTGSDLAADGAPSEGEIALLQPLVDEGLLDASILSEDAMIPPVSDASENAPSRSQRREALRILEEAGWAVSDDGILERDGEDLTLEIIIFSPTFERIFNPFIENLRSIGVDARISRSDVSTFQERLLNGDFDLVTAGYSGTFLRRTGRDAGGITNRHGSAGPGFAVAAIRHPSALQPRSLGRLLRHVPLPRKSAALFAGAAGFLVVRRRSRGRARSGGRLSVKLINSRLGD